MFERSLSSRMPPAVFTPVLGLLGLGTAWRRAGPAYGAPEAVGDLLLGFGAGLWLMLAVLYALKVVRRPGVVAEDASALPGRGGIAAGIISILLIAAALAPLWPGAAAMVLATGLILQLAYVGLVATILITGAAEQRRVSPVWHLTFVGFIVGPLAAVPLGWLWLGKLILTLMIPMAAFVYAASLRQLLTRVPPAPLRPLLAIHLAPASLTGIGAALVGWTLISQVAAGIATLILLGLLSRARWLTEAGFLPFWGAFTFPAAAYASLMTIHSGQHDVVRLWGIGVLIAASFLIPWILWRVLRLWPGGRLAQLTNAAAA